MEEDLIIGEPDQDGHLDIIESQLTVINTLVDIDNDLYDDFMADKIKVVSRALRIIYKVQAALLKELQ